MPYIKGGGWLNHIGFSVSLCARATRAILNHTPIDSGGGSFLKAIMHALVVTIG